jgi:hypothetical protein
VDDRIGQDRAEVTDIGLDDSSLVVVGEQLTALGDGNPIRSTHTTRASGAADWATSPELGHPGAQVSWRW